MMRPSALISTSVLLLGWSVACGGDGERSQSTGDGGLERDASASSGGRNGGTGGRSSGGGGGTPSGGGTASGGSTSSGGSSGSGGTVVLEGGPDPDAGPDAAEELVVTVENGGYALFEDPSGTILHRSPTPASYPLPTGGRVTLLALPAVTIFDVPAGATIRLPEASLPVTYPPRQSIRVNVTEWKPNYPVRITTACSAAQGAGEHVLAMDEGCLDDEGGELWISTWFSGDGAYINVKDIELGAASEAPLDVVLPAWTPFTTLPRFTLDEHAVEWMPGVTVHARRGPNYPLMSGSGGFTRQPDGSGVMDFNSLYDGLGTEWGLGLTQTRNDATEFGDRTTTRSNEKVGHPLPNKAFVRSELLPPPTDITVSQDGPATVISWTLEEGWTLAGADRILVKVGDPSSQHWEIWVPPDTTSVALPEWPDAGVIAPLYDLSRIEVQVEDQKSVSGWSEVLSSFQNNELFNQAYDSPDSRFSRAVMLNP